MRTTLAVFILVEMITFTLDKNEIRALTPTPEHTRNRDAVSTAHPTTEEKTGVCMIVASFKGNRDSRNTKQQFVPKYSHSGNRRRLH